MTRGGSPDTRRQINDIFTTCDSMLTGALAIAYFP